MIRRFHSLPALALGPLVEQLQLLSGQTYN